MTHSQVKTSATDSGKQAARSGAGAPVKLAQGKMGTLLAVVAGAIVLALSVSQQWSLIDTLRLLVTSMLVFWFLGWISAFVVNWHLRAAYTRQLANERKKASEKSEPKDEEAASPNTTVDQNQTSPA